MDELNNHSDVVVSRVVTPPPPHYDDLKECEVTFIDLTNSDEDCNQENYENEGSCENNVILQNHLIKQEKMETMDTISLSSLDEEEINELVERQNKSMASAKERNSKFEEEWGSDFDEEWSSNSNEEWSSEIGEEETEEERSDKIMLKEENDVTIISDSDSENNEIIFQPRQKSKYSDEVEYCRKTIKPGPKSKTRILESHVCDKTCIKLSTSSKKNNELKSEPVISTDNPSDSMDFSEQNIENSSNIDNVIVETNAL